MNVDKPWEIINFDMPRISYYGDRCGPAACAEWDLKRRGNRELLFFENAMSTQEKGGSQIIINRVNGRSGRIKTFENLVFPNYEVHRDNLINTNLVRKFAHNNNAVLTITSNPDHASWIRRIKYYPEYTRVQLNHGGSFKLREASTNKYFIFF